MAKQRKQRKLARKNPEWRTKLKKDPGIPNLFPYKEKILREIEAGRLRKQEEAERRRAMVKSARTGGGGVVEAAGEEGGDDEENDDDVRLEGDDAMDEDGDDIDESNPMAALLASARKAAKRYERNKRGGADDGGMDGDEDEDDDEAGEGGDFDGFSDSDAMQEDDDVDEEDEELVGAGARLSTSRKAYDKVFKQVVDQADVVLYVLDARDPEGTRSRDVERAVVSASSSGEPKRLILVLNKVDLVPTAVLRRWLLHLRRSFPTLPLRAAPSAAPGAATFAHPGADLTPHGSAARLLGALKAYAASRGLRRAVHVGVVGYPNVGKSSVINALLGRHGGAAAKRAGGGGGNASSQRQACPTGAEAGVTTAIRSVKIDGRLTLIDSPGIVFPSATTSELAASSSSSSSSSATKKAAAAHAHARLVLLNAVPPQHIDDPIPAVGLLLQRLASIQAPQPAPAPDAVAASESAPATTAVAPATLLDRLAASYDLPALLGSSNGGADVTTDFLVQVARRKGRLGRGGVPNINAAAMAVVTDWRDGRIQGWAEAPELVVEGVGGAGGDGGKEAGKSAKGDAGGVAPDQKVIVTEWAKEFKLEGLWGDDEGEKKME